MKTTYRAGRYYIGLVNGKTVSMELTKTQAKVLFSLISKGVINGIAYKDYYTEGVTFDN